MCKNVNTLLVENASLRWTLKILFITALAVMLLTTGCDPPPKPQLNSPTPETTVRTPTPIATPTATPQVISTPHPNKTLGGPSTDPILPSTDKCDGKICEPFEDEVASAYLISDDSDSMQTIYTGTGGLNNPQPTPAATQLAATDNYTPENSTIDVPNLASSKTQAYLPSITKCSPPLPHSPVLDHICNTYPSCDYTVSWQPAPLAESYTLQEADNATFDNAWECYHGADTSWLAVDRVQSIYYYRVKATNATGESLWSDIQRAYVLPPTTIPVIADTMVSSNQSHINFGDTTKLLAGYDTLADPKHHKVRTLLRFDLSEVPSGFPIDAVWLWLYHKSSFDIPGLERDISISVAGTRWDEHSVTWDTRPRCDQKIDQINILYAEWGWYIVDITDLALEWISRQHENHGFWILGDEDADSPNWRGFCSRELDDDCAARLTINYTGAHIPEETHRTPAPAPLILPPNNDTPEAAEEP